MNHYYELTQPQHRIWVTQMIHPASHLYHIGGYATIYGDVDLDKLRKAIRELILCHDVFQIRLSKINGTPLQYLCDEQPTDIEIISFVECDRPTQAFEQWVGEQVKKPMTLENAPLYQFYLYSLNQNTVGYFIKFHHIVVDGWSIKLIVNEIKARYECLMVNAVYEVNHVYSYLSFIESERQYIGSAAYAKGKQYWNELFDDIQHKQEESIRSIQGHRQTFLLSKEQSDALRELCKQCQVTMNSLFVSLYLLYLHKQTGEIDIVVGNPVLGRSRKKERNTIGMFVSSMPFRYQIDKNVGVATFVRDVNNALKHALKHHKYPYNHLVRDLGSDTIPLYNHCINYYNTTICNTIGGCMVDNKEFYCGEQAYSLQIIIREWLGEQIQIDVDYNIDDYEACQISDMVVRFGVLADKIALAPQQRISGLNLLDTNELRVLTKEYNDTALAMPPYGTAAWKLLMRR